MQRSNREKDEGEGEGREGGSETADHALIGQKEKEAETETGSVASTWVVVVRGRVVGCWLNVGLWTLDFGLWPMPMVFGLWTLVVRCPSSIFGRPSLVFFFGLWSSVVRRRVVIAESSFVRRSFVRSSFVRSSFVRSFVVRSFVVRSFVVRSFVVRSFV